MVDAATKKPQDFVISTGRQYSVRNFLEICAKQLNWGGLRWEGKGLNEIGRRSDNGDIVVRIDERYFRPSEVETLLGDSSLAKKSLVGNQKNH